MKKESKMIMLGMFSKNTPEYANKRKEEAAGLIEKVHISEGDYLVVKAGPFDKATADENMAKLTENGLEGYIYTDKAEREPEEAPEAVG